MASPGSCTPGASFGPRLRQGRRSLVLVGDDNFAATQFPLFAPDD